MWVPPKLNQKKRGLCMTAAVLELHCSKRRVGTFAAINSRSSNRKQDPSPNINTTRHFFIPTTSQLTIAVVKLRSRKYYNSISTTNFSDSQTSRFFSQQPLHHHYNTNNGLSLEVSVGRPLRRQPLQVSHTSPPPFSYTPLRPRLLARTLARPQRQRRFLRP